MFKIIYAHEQESHKDLVSPFLKELESRNSALCDEFPESRDTTFILANGKPNKINGGALLVSRKEESLPPEIKERLDVFIPPEQNVWVGTILLEITPDISGQDFECFSKIFYRKLYETLKLLGSREKAAFFVLILPSCEYKATELLQNWPYVLTVRPEDPNNKLYYSILALTGLRHEVTFFWKSLRALTKIKDLAA